MFCSEAQTETCFEDSVLPEWTLWSSKLWLQLVRKLETLGLGLVGCLQVWTEGCLSGILGLSLPGSIHSLR